MGFCFVLAKKQTKGTFLANKVGLQEKRRVEGLLTFLLTFHLSSKDSPSTVREIF